MGCGAGWISGDGSPSNDKPHPECWLHLIEGICKSHGIITVVCEIISTLNMPALLYIAACTIKGYGQWGWSGFW